MNHVVFHPGARGGVSALDPARSARRSPAPGAAQTLRWISSRVPFFGYGWSSSSCFSRCQIRSSFRTSCRSSALALLMASSPEETLRRDLVRTSAGVIAAGILLMAAAAILPQLLHDPARAPYFGELRLPLLGMGLVAAGGGWIARGRKDPAAALGITAYVCFAILLMGAGRVAPLYSGASLAAQISPAIMPATNSTPFARMIRHCHFISGIP